jgi:hypothetical protein
MIANFFYIFPTRDDHHFWLQTKKMPKKETEVPGTTPYYYLREGWGFRIIR